MKKQNMKQNLSKLSIASLCALGSFSANAFEIESNDVTFSVHGNFNASYIYNKCDNGGATVNGAFLCGGDTDPSAISNGYLPTIIEFGLRTTKGGYDIAVYSTFDRGLDTNEAFNVSSDTDGFRIWMDVGNADVGNFTIGRHWGVYAYDATFQDMSVYGVGGPLLTANPINTTLGAAGTGYIFLDRITQLTWTAPTSDEWVAQVGLFQPLNLSSFSFNSGAFAGAETGSDTPGVHGRLRWNIGEDGFISTTAMTQDVDATAGGLTSDYTAYGWDLTGQWNIADFSFTASYNDNQGLGHTGYFIDAVDATGKERDSDGYYVQGTYTMGKTVFGLNYGESTLDNNNVDPGTTIHTKEKTTAQVRYNTDSGIILVGEYSYLEAENKDGGDISNDVLSAGVMYFF